MLSGRTSTLKRAGVDVSLQVLNPDAIAESVYLHEANLHRGRRTRGAARAA
jgi:hypothetical protein